MAETSEEAFEIASQELASIMRPRPQSWLWLIGAFLWMVLWFLIEERLEQGADWTSPYAATDPLAGTVAFTAVLSLITVSITSGLSSALGAVTVPPPGTFHALLAVRSLPVARVLVVLGLLGTVAVPPLTLVGMEATQVLALMALPMLLVAAVPPAAVWIRARSGALAVARAEDGMFRLLRWDGHRTEGVSFGVGDLLGDELLRRGVRWRPGAEAAVQRWAGQSRLHPTEEETRTLTLPWSWAGEHGEKRAHPQEWLGLLGYGATMLTVAGFLLFGGAAIVGKTVPDGDSFGAVLGALLVYSSLVLVNHHRRGIRRSH